MSSVEKRQAHLESMPLNTGERIQATGQGVYSVGELLETTPWYELYSGRKLFYNFRYHVPEFYEVGDDEQLNVLIRTTPTDSDDSRLLAQTEQALAYEALHVLTDPSGWFPQPIDWVVAPRDVEESGTPINMGFLILSNPHGQSLQDWRDQQNNIHPIALNLVAKMLDFVQTLEDRQQRLRGFGPADFQIDEAARLICTASHRIVPIETGDNFYAALFPSTRYPQQFSAPEVIEQEFQLGPNNSDIYSWAANAVYLLTTSTEVASADFAPLAVVTEFRDILTERIVSLFSKEPALIKMLLPSQQKRTPEQVGVSFVEALEQALTSTVDERFGTVQDIRQAFLKTPPAAPSEKKPWWKKIGSK